MQITSAGHGDLCDAIGSDARFLTAMAGRMQKRREARKPTTDPNEWKWTWPDLKTSQREACVGGDEDAQTVCPSVAPSEHAPGAAAEGSDLAIRSQTVRAHAPVQTQGEPPVWLLRKVLSHHVVGAKAVYHQDYAEITGWWVLPPGRRPETVPRPSVATVSGGVTAQPSCMKIEDLRVAYELVKSGADAAITKALKQEGGLLLTLARVDWRLVLREMFQQHRAATARKKPPLMRDSQPGLCRWPKERGW